MRRILIIGCPGSGKTTLAKEMAARLRLPLVHLDALYWLDGWQPRERADFDARLLTELQKEAWILDGNYGRTLPLRLGHCDSVIFLRYPRRVCLWGAVWRALRGYGKTRSDMGPNCPEKLDMEFLKFIWTFEREYGEPYRELLEEQEHLGKRVVILRSRKEAARFVEGLRP